MKRTSIAVALLLTSCIISWGWDYYQFDLPSQKRESAWRDALAERLDGVTEYRVEGGRVDVLTDDWAIEVDWPRKWHEGLGQALHYADATDRQGVVALIAYGQGPDRVTPKTKKLFSLVERECNMNGIKLIVLFPTRPRERPAPLAQGLTHWLNTHTQTRHNIDCQFYRHTAEGRPCGPNEGHACGLCGG